MVIDLAVELGRRWVAEADGHEARHIIAARLEMVPAWESVTVDLNGLDQADPGFADNAFGVFGAQIARQELRIEVGRRKRHLLGQSPRVTYVFDAIADKLGVGRPL